MTWRTSAAAGVLLLVAAGEVVAAGSRAQQPAPTQPAARPRSVPVSAATLACPPAPRAAKSTTRIFAVTPTASGARSAPPGGAAGAPGGRPGGAARLRLLGGSAEPTELAATSVVGLPLRAAVSAGAGLVSASGTLAAGVAGASLSAYGSATTSGLAVSGCAAPQARWWFSGVDTSVGTTTRLELANPGSGVAVVDVLILGAGGPVAAPGARGVALAPASRASLDLAALAPGRAALTLRVSATRGTVSAAISTTRLAGLTPTGTDWVPPAPRPARTVVVDAGVPRATRQRLVVTNPGSRQQVVAVRLLDASGAFVPSGLPSLQVPPGSVVVRDVTAIVGSGGAAVELTASAPVTGALLSEVAGASRDFAVAGPGEALTGPAVVATMDGARLALALTATTPAPERLSLAMFDSAGTRLGVVRLVARGAATTSWALPPTSAASYVVVTPAEAGSAVQAVATYSSPAGASQLPVVSGRYTVQQPAVVQAYP